MAATTGGDGGDGDAAATSGVRLHIGGLAPEVKENEIRRKFASFGKLSSVEIIREKSGDPDVLNRPCRGFAYITLHTEDLEMCLQTFKRTRWRGRTFTVNPAKRNYLEWLRSEWKEAADIKRREEQEAMELKRLKEAETMAAVQLARKTEDDVGFIIHKSKRKRERKATATGSSTMPQKRKRGVSSIEADEDDEDIFALAQQEQISLDVTSNSAMFMEATSDGEEEDDIFAKATRTPKGSLQLDTSSQEKRTENGNASAKASNGNASVNTSLETEKQRKELANQRRIQAMERKAKESLERRKKLVGAKNSRIVFGEAPGGNLGLESPKPGESVDEGDDNNSVEKNELSEAKGSPIKSNFLGDSSDEASDNDIDDFERFKPKPQFDQKGGYKLLQMQRKFGGDPRFKLDERFLESDDENEQEENDANQELTATEEKSEPMEDEELTIQLQKEKSAALSILDNVLPPPRKIRELRVEDPDREKRERSQNLWRPMKRFDPTAVQETAVDTDAPTDDASFNSKESGSKHNSSKKRTRAGTVSVGATQTKKKENKARVEEQSSEMEAESIWNKNSWNNVMTEEKPFQLAKLVKEKTEQPFQFFPGESIPEKNSKGPSAQGFSFGFSFQEQEDDKSNNTISSQRAEDVAEAEPHVRNRKSADESLHNEDTYHTKKNPAVKVVKKSSFMRNESLEEMNENWLKHRGQASLDFKRKMRNARRGRRSSRRKFGTKGKKRF